MIDSSKNDTFEISQSLKAENLTSDDYEEICNRLGENQIEQN